MKRIKILFIVFIILLICLPIISCDITKVDLTNDSSHPIRMNLIYSFVKDTTMKFIDSVSMEQEQQLSGYTPKGLPKDYILHSISFLSKNGFIVINSNQVIKLPDSGNIKIIFIYAVFGGKGLSCNSANASDQPVVSDRKVIHAIHLYDTAEEPDPEGGS